MNKIRVLSSKTYIIIPLLLLFLVFSSGCKKERDSIIYNNKTMLVQKKGLQVEQQIQSGEDLFKGILFGEGIVGENFSDFTFSIQSLAKTKEEKNAIVELENEIILSIKRQHPDYFENFQKRITSGNISEIEKELLLASKTIYEAVNFDQSKIDAAKSRIIKDRIDRELRHFESNDFAKYKSLIKYIFQDYNKRGIVQPTSLNVNVSYQTNTAIYMYIAAVVAAAMVLVVFIGKNGINNVGSESDPLFREQFVAKIAETLRMGRD